MIPIGQWLAQLPDAKAWPPLWSAGEMADHSGALTREREVEAAYARGKSEAEADFSAKLAGVEMAARQQYAELLDLERQRWLREEAGPLAQRFGAAMEAVGLQLSNEIAGALRPFLAEAAREKALADFNRMLESHIASSDGSLVRIRAPRDIVDTITPVLPQGSSRYKLEEADGCEVIVEVGSTTFETQVGKWLSAIGADANG